MLRYNWVCTDINTLDEWEDARKRLQHTKTKHLIMDTETTGLHIMKDRPFLFQFGFVSKLQKTGYSYTVPIPKNKNERLLFNTLFKELCSITKDMQWVGHNIKFDLHMLCNLGWRFDKMQNATNKFTDTQFYIRYAHDALHTEEGGPPLKLKEYTARYIDHKAKYFETELKNERSRIAQDYNIQLRKALGIRVQDIKTYFSDPLYEVSDLPEAWQETYREWLRSLPLYLQPKVHTLVEPEHISYETLNRGTLLHYAHRDIIYTAEILYSLLDAIEGRHQQKGIQMENNLILPLLRLERTGFEVDHEYLEDSRVRLKEYILKRREDLRQILGETINIGQHQRIRQLLLDKFELGVPSTADDQLALLKNDLSPEHPAAQFISVLQELRTLTKWYSAYIVRFQKDLKRYPKLHTTINQVGTVSGRVTSDFQQFPSSAIYDAEGIELFHPRKIIKTNYAIAYLDYSQIELRVQAHYTMLLGSPDLNLCRAYYPHECIERDGKYYLKESPETEWKPTDIHGATTTAATGVTPDDPKFEYLRKHIGKPVNFAKNYGAQLSRMIRMFPDKSLEECEKINDAYYTAFPGIKVYHKYCNDRAAQYSNTPSLFNIRYYNVSGHKLKNLLIQGSSAHLLKQKIALIDQLIFDYSQDIRMQMQIHDELSFEIYSEKGFSFLPQIKLIMEDWPDCSMPIIAELEVTRTNWAEKRKVA